VAGCPEKTEEKITQSVHGTPQADGGTGREKKMREDGKLGGWEEERKAQLEC